MKLTHRAVALGVVAALTFAAPGAAHAAGKSAPKGKTKVSQQQQQAAKAKAAAARKKAEQARKKAEKASHFAFPGLVTAVSPATSTVTIQRKERGVTVSRTFVLDSRTEVKRDGVRVSLADIRPGDKAVGIGTRVNGVLVLRKLNAEGAVSAPVTEPVSDTPTATIVI